MNAPGLLLALSISFVRQPPSDRPAPKRPAERFTLYLEADPNAAGADQHPLDEVLDEVADKLRKRKSWILLADSKEKAEGVVRLLSHRIREEHVNTLAPRVRYRGLREGGEVAPIELVDTNYLSERHYLRATIALFGLARVLVGHDGRKRGADLARAAAHLAQSLEDFLKESYWELEDRRRRSAAAGLHLPEPEEDPPPSPEPPAAAPVDPAFESYLSAIESYRRGELVSAARDVCTLTSAELYRLSTAFLAGDWSGGEVKAAALLHTECVVTFPNEVQTPLALARRTAQHLETARRYGHAILETSDRVRFQKRWHLAAAYYSQRDLRSTEAISLLSSGLQMFPADPELLLSLGAFFQASGTLGEDPEALDQAETIYRALFENSFETADLERRLAHVLILKGQIDEAEALLERSRGDDGESLPVLMLRGRLAWERGLYDEAQASYESAWELDPGCQACAVALASAYERNGRPELAGRFVKRFLQSGTEGETDAWWDFLLGPASGMEPLLLELRSEVSAR